MHYWTYLFAPFFYFASNLVGGPIHQCCKQQIAKGAFDCIPLLFSFLDIPQIIDIKLLAVFLFFSKCMGATTTMNPVTVDKANTLCGVALGLVHSILELLNSEILRPICCPSWVKMKKG